MSEGVGFVPIYRCRGPWVYYVYQFIHSVEVGVNAWVAWGLQVSVDDVGVWVSGGCGWWCCQRNATSIYIFIM